MPATGRQAPEGRGVLGKERVHHPGRREVPGRGVDQKLGKKGEGTRERWTEDIKRVEDGGQGGMSC